MTHRYYENADAVIAVYSGVEGESFRDLQDYWFRELHHYLRIDDDNIPILLVANKVDLLPTTTEPVDFTTTKELALQKGLLPPLECSAKTGHNVKRAFHVIATELFKKNHSSNKPKVSSVSVSPSQPKCCSKGSSDVQNELTFESLRVDQN